VPVGSQCWAPERSYWLGDLADRLTDSNIGSWSERCDLIIGCPWSLTKTRCRYRSIVPHGHWITQSAGSVASILQGPLAAG
jgi:hypothetical protein